MVAPKPTRFLVCSVLLIGACATPQQQPAPPTVDIPAEWTSSPPAYAEIWPDRSWWQQFGSMELESLIQAGQQSNLEIAAAMTRVQQAEAQARIAGVPLLPSVSATANTSRQGTFHDIVTKDRYASGFLVVDYELDFWGKNRAGQAAAEATLRANQYAQETVALTVTSSLASTYLQILSLRDQLRIARLNVANAERVLRLVDAQGRYGAASPLDLARQRSVVASQQAIIPQLAQQEREARAALAILLGRPPQTFDVAGSGLDNIRLPRVSPGLPSELLSRRPDIRRAEAVLRSADANIAAARAALFPSIHLTSSSGLQSDSLSALLSRGNVLFALGASLTAPIFDAGRLRSQRDLAIAQKDEMLHTYRTAVITAFSEVDTALGAIQSLKAQDELKTQEMQQADLAFTLAEIRYRAGAEDLLTVLDTQRALYDVQNQLGQIKLQRLQAAVSLFKALGGGWQDSVDMPVPATSDAANAPISARPSPASVTTGPPRSSQ